MIRASQDAHLDQVRTTLSEGLRSLATREGQQALVTTSTAMLSIMAGGLSGAADEAGAWAATQEGEDRDSLLRAVGDIRSAADGMRAADAVAQALCEEVPTPPEDGIALLLTLAHEIETTTDADELLGLMQRGRVAMGDVRAGWSEELKQKEAEMTSSMNNLEIESRMQLAMTAADTLEDAGFEGVTDALEKVAVDVDTALQSTAVGRLQAIGLDV